MFQILGIDHVVLRVRDASRMTRFYCDVLGCNESGGEECGVKRLRDVQDVRADGEPRHVVVQQPRVRVIDPPGFPSPLFNPLLPRQLRLGKLRRIEQRQRIRRRALNRARKEEEVHLRVHLF